MKKSLGAKTLAFPTPVWLVGTYDKDGKANIMTAAWAAGTDSSSLSVTSAPSGPSSAGRQAADDPSGGHSSPRARP